MDEPSKQGIKYQPVAGHAHNYGRLVVHYHQLVVGGGDGSGKAQGLQYGPTRCANLGAERVVEAAVVGQPLLVAKKPGEVHEDGNHQEAVQQPVASGRNGAG